MKAPAGRDQAAVMDSLYRGQRHIYDATRKYYLFGRDRMIDRLDCRAGDAVLEIGCGTGRNLDRIGRRWPGSELHGLDISTEMLKSAAARLGQTARLAQGDATSFDAARLFGREGFDRVVISFALSMIPDWQGAVRQAVQVLAPGGVLHIVDFGDCRGLPGPARGLLRRWLAHFHVAPRLDLPDFAHSLAVRRGLSCRARRGPLGYYTLVRIERRQSRRAI
jgi:S-adenosylmethionine-diacylgycerolhomoserine-N-methlytransferase